MPGCYSLEQQDAGDDGRGGRTPEEQPGSLSCVDGPRLSGLRHVFTGCDEVKLHGTTLILPRSHRGYIESGDLLKVGRLPMKDMIPPGSEDSAAVECIIIYTQAQFGALLDRTRSEGRTKPDLRYMSLLLTFRDALVDLRFGIDLEPFTEGLIKQCEGEAFALMGYGTHMRLVPRAVWTNLEVYLAAHKGAITDMVS